jgi:hypothetical protein
VWSPPATGCYGMARVFRSELLKLL